MESTKTHMGKNYAFDATAQGKGLWKELTKKGKLGRIASKDLQQRWGNPNETGPLYETPKTNVDKMSGMIKDTSHKTEKLKSLRSLLKDPNETVKSATFKSLKQNLTPEMIVKQLFGKTAGLMTAKNLGVSSARMNAVAEGFEGSKDPTNKSSLRKNDKSNSDNSELNSFLKKITEELTKIREKLYSENTIAVKFSKSSDTYKYLKDISEYANEEKKRKDLEENFKQLPQKQGLPNNKTSPTAVPTNMPQSENQGGGGIFDIITSMFGGLLGGAGAGIGIAGLGKKLLSVIGKAFLGVAKKLPIIGPIIIAAMGLKDAYDEYMSGGDFSDAVGAFFESAADGLTFGLASSLAGEGGIKKFVSGMVDSGLEFFKNATNSIGGFIKNNLIDPIVNIPQTLLNGIKGVVGDILESIGNLSFEIPEFTLIPETRFTKAVKVGPYKIAPFSSLAETGKSLKEASKKGKADMAAEAQAAEAQAAEAQAAEAQKEQGDGKVDVREIENQVLKQELPKDITFSEMKLAENDKELYDQFKDRREQIKKELEKDPRFAKSEMSEVARRQIADKADIQAKREFAERAETVGAAEIHGERPKNKPPMQDQTKSFEIPDASLGGTDESSKFFDKKTMATTDVPTSRPTAIQQTQSSPSGSPPTAVSGDGRVEELPKDIIFSERELSEKNPDLYKQFVDRREQLKEELAKDPKYQSRTGAGRLEDAANTQAIREFAERAETVGAAQIHGATSKSFEIPDASLGGTDESSKFFDKQLLPLMPEQRKTGDVIDKTATELAETQMAAATQPASQPVINNVTNNNVSGGGGGGKSQPAAPVRNDEPTLMRTQMDAAILATS